MNKSMKKLLILALVVLTMAATAVFVSASEATNNYCSECKAYVPVTTGKSYPATCEQKGYIEMICKPCKDKGIYTKLFKVDTDNASGHEYTKSYELVDVYTDETETVVDYSYYRCVESCAKKCGYSKIFTEKDADGKEVDIRFYKITYVNSFVTAKTDSSCLYTDLATEYKEEVLYTEYVQAGNQAGYAANPYRMPDKYWGAYNFVGWSLTQQASVDIDNSKIPLHFHNFDVPLEGVKTADYKFYAVFQGISSTHDVTFYTENGARIINVKVNHGYQIADSQIPEAPKKPDNVQYKFTFDYWTLENIISKFDFEKPIYGDVALRAHYYETLKVYRLQYLDKNGNPYMSNGQIIYDDVNVAGFGEENRLKPEKGLDIEIAPWFDSAYDYTYAGQWYIEGRDNAVVDLKHVSLPDDVLDYEQTQGTIKLRPKFVKVARIYDMTIKVRYDNDGNYHPDEIDVQVTDANGKPVGVCTLTKNDIVSYDSNKMAIYQKVIKVSYSSQYRVVATSRNYKNSDTEGFVNFRNGGTNYNDYGPGGVSLTLMRIEGPPCNCICHTIFKPVWVGILNMLYALFKAEFVCCDDMFANIGDNLAYGPSKS